MAYILGEALAAWGMALFIYFVMLTLVVSYGESAYLYWTLWIIFIAGVVVITYKAARTPAQAISPFIFFALGAACVLIVGFLASSAHFEVVPNWIALAGFCIVGLPLGNGAVRYLHGAWRKPSLEGILLGCATGIVGVLLAVLIMQAISRSGWNPFVPAASIPTFSALGLTIEPYGSWRPFRFLAFVVLQGTQSTLAALWDTLILGAVVLAATSLAVRLRGR